MSTTPSAPAGAGSTPASTAAVPTAAPGQPPASTAAVPTAASAPGTSPTGLSTSPTGRSTGRTTARTGQLPPLPAPRGLARVFAMPDLNGPRIRVGILWFGLLAAAFWGGLGWLGALYAFVAGIAALQSAREWRKVGSQPSKLVAALGAAGMPIAAIWGIGLVGVVALAIPALALVASLLRRRHRTPFLAAAGCTVRVSVFAGIAAASPVMMYRSSIIGALLLVGFICAFDMGNFMVGAEAATPLPGIFAGLIVVGVGACAVSVLVTVFELEPFADPLHPWIFGGVVGLCAPFGGVIASLVLPAASAQAPALRRIDSLILAGPAFLVLFWQYLGVGAVG